MMDNAENCDSYKNTFLYLFRFGSRDGPVIMSCLNLFLCIMGGSMGVNVEWGCKVVGLLCERLPNDHIKSV
jgi:hypothetical protein